MTDEEKRVLTEIAEQLEKAEASDERNRAPREPVSASELAATWAADRLRRLVQ